MKILCRSLLLIAALITQAHAASSVCGTDPQPNAEEVSRIMENAVALKTALDAHPDEVVILVRQGQDLRQFGLQFSHAAWAKKNENGHWQVIHNLNICETPRSELFAQGLYEFLSDGLTGKQVAILRPTPEWQAGLKALLSQPKQAQLLHDKRYSLVAYPFFWRYQNSNGWLLESFAQVYQPKISSRMSAQQWLQQQKYQPSEISPSLFERIYASLLPQNIFIDDRPDALVKAGKISFSSGDSVITFMSRFSQRMTDCNHQQWGDRVCIFTLPVGMVE